MVPLSYKADVVAKVHHSMEAIAQIVNVSMVSVRPIQRHLFEIVITDASVLPRQSILDICASYATPKTLHARVIANLIFLVLVVKEYVMQIYLTLTITRYATP